jgi:TonB family protein
MSENDQFFEQVSDLVQKAWALDKILQLTSHKVQLCFRIQKDGQMSNLRMTASSGLARLDMAALKAVQSASPFSCPPSVQDCHLQADFEYDVDSDTKQVRCKFRIWPAST